MDLKEYEHFVRDSASPKYDKKLAIIGLIGEVGELADVVKKEAIYEDMSKFEEKYGMTVAEKIADEAGDVLWQFQLVLIKYGLDFQKVLDDNFEKLMRRHDGIKTATDGGGER